LPTIIQTPNGPIHKGNKVTLTSVIQEGNPLAAITWPCDGATQITPTGSLFTSTLHMKYVMIIIIMTIHIQRL
jgi:hypothetical protein